MTKLTKLKLMSNASNAFEKYLTSRKLKLTAERRKVLQEVLTSKSHINVDKLHLKLQLEPRGISKATVYRTIDLLAEAGVIRKLKIFGDRHTYYEGFGSRENEYHYHYHLVCEVCGKVSEFANLQIEGRLKKVCDKFEFAPEDFNLIIYGTCQECSEGGV